MPGRENFYATSEKNDGEGGSGGITVIAVCAVLLVLLAGGFVAYKVNMSKKMGRMGPAVEGVAMPSEQPGFIVDGTGTFDADGPPIEVSGTVAVAGDQAASAAM